MSAPAMKAFSPDPVMITTRMPVSLLMSWNAALSSSIVAILRAFSTFGRLMVMYAIEFFFSKRIFSKFISFISSQSLERQSYHDFLNVSVPPWLEALQFVRLRIIGVRIVVKALARLSSVPAGHHESLQQWRRGEPSFLELVVHHVGDVISRVQSDKIKERERAHRIAATELHCVVYVVD